MRIVVISDVHSNLEALRAVLNKTGRPDLIINLGDLVGYGANPNEVVGEIRDLKIRTLHIRGNHDQASLTAETWNFNPYAARAILWTASQLTEENKDFLCQLPLKERTQLGNAVTQMFHGSPRNPLDEYIFPWTDERTLQQLLQMAKANLLLLGHTHMPMNVQLSLGRILNPGAVGQSRDGDPRASYAEIEVDQSISAEIKRVDYEVEVAAEKILKAGLPPMLAERLFLGV